MRIRAIVRVQRPTILRATIQSHARMMPHRCRSNSATVITNTSMASRPVRIYARSAASATIVLAGIGRHRLQDSY